MHLKHKIAQMLMIGFKGETLEKNSPIMRDLRQKNIGGVILFDRDPKSFELNSRNIHSPEQLRQLILQLQTESENTLLVGLDYEGGDKSIAGKNRLGVSRLNPAYGFPSTCTAKEFAELSYEKAVAAAAQMSNTAKIAGINVVFAPVVDITIFPGQSCVDLVERSFSSDITKVIECAELFIDAYHKNKIACCLKHFPGYGSASKDTHFSPSDITATWCEAELQPYQVLGKKCDMVMTTHVTQRNLDASGLPATLSKSMLQDLLRTQLNFPGVIVADDLQMKGLTQPFTLEEIVELALKAGNDILLFGNMMEYDPFIAPKVIEIIFNLVKLGKITESRIDESYQRINRLKTKMSLNIN